MIEKHNQIARYISTVPDFQYSINIEYDLYSDEKIKNYIPTTGAIDIIEDVMLSLSPRSTERARIFVGSYGKGKSHLALILISLLFRKEENLFTDFLIKVKDNNYELYQYILEYIHSDKKLLPVLIQGGNMGIKQSLIYGLKKSLDMSGLDNIMPRTYFHAAISTIDNWRNNYTDTYKEFEKKINTRVADFVAELSEFNPNVYDRFIEIYPSLTAGSEFNPVSVVDVVDLYSDVVDKIRDYGYQGIFVVYDEFSKFLEGSLQKTTANEVEQLQKFAEKCNRSKDNQIHIMLISHKSILNYIDRLPKTKVDAWKAVSNRFKTIELNNNSMQTYQIMSSAIVQNKIWFESYQKENRKLFEDVYSKWRNNKMFTELTDREFEKVVYECYPLEPVTSFLLPRISEKIAQNERTLFTFLCAQNQKYTFSYYLNNTEDALPLLTPDYVYDYFEPLFKAENYNTDIHKIWKAVSVALNKIGQSSTLERKMLKAIALVYILDQFETLPPDMQMLMDVYNGSIYDMDIVVAALTHLEKQGLIKKLDNKNYLRIAEHTDVNIEELINDTIDKRKTQANTKNVLNDYVGNRALYPTAYNDQREITRFFNFEFITYDEVLSVDNWEKKIDGISSDGIVYAIITRNEVDISDIHQAAKDVINARILLIVPKIAMDVCGAINKYDAIKYIMENSNDEVLIDELSYSFRDLNELIDQYIDIYLRPELSSAKYFLNGEEKTINRRSQLSRCLSDICANVFVNAPIINNEVINKNSLSPTAANSRDKVIGGLLQNIIKPDLGLVGTGQDVSFMRSTIKNTGILTIINDRPALNIENLPDRGLQRVINTIRAFFIRSTREGRLCFKDLYDELQLPKYGYGLRKGIIPVYIAAVLHFYKKQAVVTSQKWELEISSKLLESINEKPENYYFFLEDWDEQKELFIVEMEKLFSKYVNEYEKEYNNFDYIVKAMQRWFMQLSKYTKDIQNSYTGDQTVSQIESSTLKLKNSLRQAEINPREFLFEKLLWIYNVKEFTPDIVRNVAHSKELLDECKRRMLEILAKGIRNIFVTKKHKPEASLFSVIRDWYEQLDDSVITHLFNNGEEKFLEFCKTITADSNAFIENVAKTCFALRVDDWREQDIPLFLDMITKYKEVIEKKSVKSDILDANFADTGVYKISFIDATGNETYKTFDKTTYSNQASLLYNDTQSMLDEYGEALSPNEKRQVLIDIINKLLG